MDELKLTGLSRLGLRRLDHASNAASMPATVPKSELAKRPTKSKTGRKTLADIKDGHGNPGGLNQARSCVDEVAIRLSLFA